MVDLNNQYIDFIHLVLLIFLIYGLDYFLNLIFSPLLNLILLAQLVVKAELSRLGSSLTEECLLASVVSLLKLKCLVNSRSFELPGYMEHNPLTSLARHIIIKQAIIAIILVAITNEPPFNC